MIKDLVNVYKNSRTYKLLDLEDPDPDQPLKVKIFSHIKHLVSEIEITESLIISEQEIVKTRKCKGESSQPSFSKILVTGIYDKKTKKSAILKMNDKR